MIKRSSKSEADRSGTAREQMQLRYFPPKQRATLLQTLRFALQVKSEQDLPKVFQVPVAVALKPGSWTELAERFNVPGDKSAARRTAFKSAKALYCRSDQYDQALRSCEQLFSIDMEPAGPPARPVNNRRQTPAQISSPGGARADRKAQGTRRTPEQRRSFYPDQYSDLLNRFCQGLAVTEEDLPPFLRHPIAVPLKIGANEDMIKRFGLPEDKTTPERRALNAALGRYCRSTQYHHAMLNCATRFSIDMEPDAPITDADRANAIQWLRALGKRRQARRQKQEQETVKSGC